MKRGWGNIGRAYAVLCVTFCFIISAVLIIPAAAAADASAAEHVRAFSFSDLLAGWGSVIFDPATYTTWTQMGGFLDFLRNETFLSSFTSSEYNSLSSGSVLGTIPNIFFVACLLCAVLSVAVALAEIRKFDRSKRIIRK